MPGYRRNLCPISFMKIIDGDVRDKVAVDEAKQRVEVVFHLAVSVSNKRSIDQPIKDGDINALGTLKI